MKIKICGITNVEDGLAAAGAGADFLGFILYSNVPRYEGVEQAQVIMAAGSPPVPAAGAAGARGTVGWRPSRRLHSICWKTTN